MMLILKGAFLALIVLLAAMVLNTMRKISGARKLEGKHTEFTEDELKPYGETLSKMIRCATVSVKDGHDDTEFAKMRAVVEEDFPLLHEKAERMIFAAAPYVLSAGTDAWRLTPVCDCVLRFAPTRMSNQQLGSIHAVDENLDIAAVAEAAVFYKYFVENYK